jgi:hypothetical protein
MCNFLILYTHVHAHKLPAGTRGFSLILNNQNSFGAHPAAWSMDTGCSFAGRKMPGV